MTRLEAAREIARLTAVLEDALGAGDVVPVDLAWVGSRVFVNNVSFGA